MNVICGFIEAITATIELIGMGVGNLSVMWSHCSGIYHMIFGPLLGGGCGTLTALCQDFMGGIVGSPLGQSISATISNFMAGWGPK